MTISFSNQLVAEMYQPSWAAWPAREFLTDASAVAVPTAIAGWLGCFSPVVSARAVAGICKVGAQCSTTSPADTLADVALLGPDLDTMRAAVIEPDRFAAPVSTADATGEDACGGRRRRVRGDRWAPAGCARHPGPDRPAGAGIVCSVVVLRRRAAGAVIAAAEGPG